MVVCEVVKLILSRLQSAAILIPSFQPYMTGYHQIGKPGNCPLDDLKFHVDAPKEITQHNHDQI